MIPVEDRIVTIGITFTFILNNWVIFGQELIRFWSNDDYFLWLMRVKPAYYFCIFWFFWKKTQAKCPAMKRFVELSLLMVYYIEHFQLFSAADFKYFSKSIFGRCSGEKLILNTVKRVYKWQNHWVEISSELTKISVKLTAAVFNDTIFFRLYSVVYKRHKLYHVT